MRIAPRPYSRTRKGASERGSGSMSPGRRQSALTPTTTSLTTSLTQTLHNTLRCAAHLRGDTLCYLAALPPIVELYHPRAASTRIQSMPIAVGSSGKHLQLFRDEKRVRKSLAVEREIINVSCRAAAWVQDITRFVAKESSIMDARWWMWVISASTQIGVYEINSAFVTVC